MRGDVRLPISVAMLLILAVVAPPAGGSNTRPTVTLVDAQPVVVSGRYFRSFERVILRTTIKGRQFRKHVVATRVGRFTARLASVDAECSPFIVIAVGDSGNRATFRRINIPPACHVPIAP